MTTTVTREAAPPTAIEEAATDRPLAQERRRALVFPREHGAWGILLIPLATGAGAALLRGGRILPVMLFLSAALVLFWMRTPAESWFGAGPMRAQSKEEVRLVRDATLLLASGALILLSTLLWQGRNARLLILGVVAAAAFLGQATLKKAGRKARALSQIVGAIGLTCAAPGAYYVSTGQFGATAYGLWIANWIFVANQVQYVQMRIRGARVEGFLTRCEQGASFLEGHVVAIGLLLMAVRFAWLPAAALLAFVPELVRGLVWFFAKPETLLVRRIQRLGRLAK